MPTPILNLPPDGEVVSVVPGQRITIKRANGTTETYELDGNRCGRLTVVNIPRREDPVTVTLPAAPQPVVRAASPAPAGSSPPATGSAGSARAVTGEL